MQKGENQRVQLTKRLLKESLISMLNVQGIHKISIRELCEIAGINRSTFYKYYGSQYDLLEEMENELLQLIQERISVHDPEEELGVQTLAALLSYLETNIDLARQLINHNIDPEFPEKLIQLPQIQSMIKGSLGTHFREKDYKYVSQYVVQGSYNLIKAWINSSPRDPAEEIAELIIRLSGNIYS